MSRDITKLHPVLQQKIVQLKIECAKQGLIIGISECIRTVAEQDALYAQGRTKPGRIVTNCKGVTYSSMHQWGSAVDFYRNDGKGAYMDTDQFFTKVGKIGQSLGLEWGGAWKSPVDKPHFQLSDWGSTTSRLKAKYKTPEDFKKSWSMQPPASNVTPPSTMDVSKQVIKVVQAWLMEYTGHKLVLDGVYGKESKTAMIKAIQKSVGMSMTGKSTDAMYSKVVPVKLGSTGNLTKCLEGLLFIHGYNPQEFGGNCTKPVELAVATSQRDKKIVVDKIAGKKTFKVLLA